MRKGWLIAAALGSVAGTAQAADVRIFGISTPESGKWAVYAQITNTASAVAAGAQVAGISSIGISVVNTPGSTTVTGAQNMLPHGTTPYVDNQPPFDTNPLNVGYGFWLPTKSGQQGPDNGTLGQEPVPPGSPATGRTGVFGIAGAQDPLSTSNTIPYQRLVLPGVGLTRGATTTNADFTSATSWGAPVLVAKGTYTPPSPTSTVGMKIEYYTDTVSLLRDTDPSANVSWDIESAVGASVVSAKSFTTNTLVTGNTTVRASNGDATLDGQVDFNDLVKLAQNYNTTTGNTWFDGDFNYDGAVDFNDLVILAQNYNTPVPAAGVPAMSFEDAVSAAFAQVPEPGTLGMIGTVVTAMFCRRRRR